MFMRGLFVRRAKVRLCAPVNSWRADRGSDHLPQRAGQWQPEPSAKSKVSPHYPHSQIYTWYTS